ncbi:MAG: hypothetical protein H6661_12950 [Ardenticatenaceae bacterium]|nr:hypothetical protein [Ardenticatenaceae bacterium]
MSEAVETLTQDLRILEAMVTEMDAYLASDATHWPMNQAGMPPKLTVGGCLMRQARLLIVQDRLPTAERVNLHTAVDAFHDLLKDHVVRFENRAHDELHARLREWTAYLRNAASQVARDHYVGTVDTRVVISSLMDKLQTPPYKLNSQIAQDVGHIDNYLKAQWQPGDFIFPDVWQEAYPQPKYWWLYGEMKGGI